MKYLKRLNWSGWGTTYVLCILAGMCREDGDLFTSFIIGMCFGFIFSLFPLFAGIKPKNY